MKAFLMRNPALLVVSILVLLYSVYFSYFTVLRYQTLYASYFDLGIMHQTVFNTYKAISSFDFSRFLELTNPFGPEQIKRMAIHNDILLAPLALFYFIHDGPETLLVLQSVITAIGAFFVYGIARVVFKNSSYSSLLSVALAFCYLMYPSLQRANMYEFHAVVLSTTFLLGMFYFYLVKRYTLSILFLVLSLLTKEQLGLTTAFFGLYVFYTEWKGKKNYTFPIIVTTLSIGWFLLSMLYIIPHFRGGHHFALGYYGDFGDSPLKIIIGIFQNPLSLARYIFRMDTVMYFVYMFGPAGFLGLLSPLHAAIVAPEFGVNLLSKSGAMRTIVFHYTAVIQPFVIIASIYGIKVLIEKYKTYARFIPLYILVMTLLFAYWKGPLPFAREQEVHPFLYPQAEYKEVAQWKKILRSESLKISTTGQLAPHFASRRYFYTFSEHYPLADYIVLRPNEIYNYPEKDVLIPVYEKLVKDERFEQIHKSNGLEIYKKK